MAAPSLVSTSQHKALPESTESLTGQINLMCRVRKIVQDREQFHRSVYLLSQYVRCGFEKGIEKVLAEPELIKPHVMKLLPRYGYVQTDRDPTIWLSPRTKDTGWIKALPTGYGLWEAPFIVGGFYDGAASRDLQRMIRRAKNTIFEEYCDTIKSCKGVLTDQLELRYQSPWYELKKEVSHFEDVATFFEQHPQMEQLFGALFSFSQQSELNPRH